MGIVLRVICMFGSPQGAKQNCSRLFLFKASRHPIRSARHGVYHLLPASIQLNPGISKNAIGGIDFAVVMQGRTAVSSHDNYVVSKSKQPNMVMLEVVHMHLSRFRIGKNLSFGKSFAGSKPLADLDEMVRHEATPCGDIVDRRSVSTHLKYFRLIEVIQDLPCLLCFN